MSVTDVPLPALATVAPAVRCGACECCPVDVCASAVEQGSSCAMMPAVEYDDVLRCPCAPVVCRCDLPAHVRGIARCRHFLPASGLAALGIGPVLLPATYQPRSGPWPVGRHCRRCGAGPGALCLDLRRRSHGAEAPPRVRPHRERRQIGTR